jgi:hypothetical protein
MTDWVEVEWRAFLTTRLIRGVGALAGALEFDFFHGATRALFLRGILVVFLGCFVGLSLDSTLRKIRGVAATFNPGFHELLRPSVLASSFHF